MPAIVRRSRRLRERGVRLPARLEGEGVQPAARRVRGVRLLRTWTLSGRTVCLHEGIQWRVLSER